MNSTRATLSDALKSRLAIGHMNGHPLPIIENPLPYAPAGAFSSTASDMMKYLAANIGLTKTNLSSAVQISHQTRFNTNMTGFSGHDRIYVGLAWFTIASPDIGKTGIIIWDNGLFNGFNPNKQRGVVILCSTIQRNFLVSQTGFGPYDD